MPNSKKSSTEVINHWLEGNYETMVEIATDIWNHPELAYEEVHSSKVLADYLEANGFEVIWKTAEIDTAFTAVWTQGQQKPILGFLAEYDALSQIGHACGHNLLGTAVCAAAIALKEDMIKTGANGTVRVYGCPAEEIMSGKIVMNQHGVFDDIDVAVTWHPFDRNRVSNDIWQAQDIKNYTFHGVSAHASMAPADGRSALDAAELMNIGVNYMREHVTSDVRMHYAYLNNGIPANVVPDFAKTNYFIRSCKYETMKAVSERVDNCARGAALMTGTTVDIELVKTGVEMKVNRVLTEIYYDAMKEIETPTYTEEELAIAAEISEQAGFKNKGVYFTGLEALEPEPVVLSIGTDASQVSHTVPLITVSAATMCKGTPLHHWAAAKQAGMSIGFKGMLYAAKAMAIGTKRLMENEGAIERAWEFHRTHD